MNLIQFLMTPNDVLHKLFNYIFILGEAFFLYCISTNILGIAHNTKKKYLYIFITTISCILINSIIKSSIRDILNLAVFVLSFHYMFHQSIKDTFVGLIISYISVFISDYLSETTFMLVFNLSLSNLLNIPLLYLTSCLLFFFYMAIIYTIIKFRKKLIPKKKMSLKITIIINLILGVISIFMQSYMLSVYTDLIPFELTLISTICLLIYFAISMYSLIRTNNLEKTTEDLEKEKIYNKTLTIMHDNIRCFKHDFNNIVQSIGGYIALNDIDGLKNYYEHLLEDCKQTNNLNILNPETINNPSIYSLLTNKYYIANEKGIQMNFDIFTDLNNINFNIYEFTRILGILLDNAIEAAQETEEKLIDIEFKSSNKKQLFIITNSCKDNNISTSKIFEKGFSTKKQNSGIGLWKVHKILAKNTNMDLFTTVGENKFRQQLEIFY